jgi:hypothetical protein
VNNDTNKFENDFISNLLNYIHNDKIKINISDKSGSEFTFESPDKSIKIKFILDAIHHKIFYDIYLSIYQKHLWEKTITDFEKMYVLARQNDKWHLPEYLPDTLMLLDVINNWAKKTDFKIEGKIIS